LHNTEGYDEFKYATGALPQSDNPLDAVLDTIGARVKKELDSINGNVSNIATGSASVPYLNYFQDTTSYSSWAHFNSRTGWFTTQEDAMRLNPENYTTENRATKQMSYYFDVDSYTEQYNRHRLWDSQKKRALTRKEVNYFNKMKREKKQMRARKWLLL
jgi:hypothetical protein